ncbi:MAG TPA: YafY family protein [Acidimicrobiales bacterium]|nr:YafY family protein [Acidimicrobiales bacterium]
MNRTDRLYAIVEELRAKAPRAWTARQLSQHFEVSTRTIERDVLALQEAGVPIWATTGPGGGYTVDPAMTLPPLNFTPDEAMAIAVALAVSRPMPFVSGAHSALRKLVAAMPAPDRHRARDLVGRVHLVRDSDIAAPSPVLRTVERAVLDGVVVELDYTDRDGARTVRAVEPFGVTGTNDNWYLMGWCRLRNDGRVFRFDRIHAAATTGEPVPRRSLDEVAGNYADRLMPIFQD